MGKTSIEWTERSWNPVTGCSKVSPGCDHCYAEAMSLRFKRSFGPWTGANARANVILHPERLEEPLAVRKPSMFFTCSMGDLFHELVPWDYQVRVFDIMARSFWHTFQVLTKRPGRMAHFAEHIWPVRGGLWSPVRPVMGNTWPGTAWPRNVWAGTSVESAKYLPRLDVLARVPARVHFVSAEPLLGPLDLGHINLTHRLKTGMRDVLRWRGDGAQEQSVTKELNKMFANVPPEMAPWINVLSGDAFDGWDYSRGDPWVNWVIAGGESGPGFRAPDPAWVRSIRDQCVAAGVPFFFKQWGGRRPGGPALLDGREWREMPDGSR